MTLPNCFIVGAAKAGTSSLSNYLSQHPDVFFLKDFEPDYFSKNIDKGIEYYSSLFSAGVGKKIIGEPSTSYFHNPDVPEILKSQLGSQVKIIISIRNPIQRAYSDYLMGVNNAVEKRDFLTSLVENEKQIKEYEKLSIKYNEFPWRSEYLQVGLYYEHIERYWDTFGKENIFIADFSELKKDSLKLANNLYKFLGLHSLESIDDQKVNSYNPTFKIIKQALGNDLFVKIKNILPATFRNKIKGLSRKEFDIPPMSGKEKSFLLDFYRNDVVRLNELVEIDSMEWLE